MISSSSASPLAPASLACVRVGYKNASQFLVAYCSNLVQGRLFVRCPEPFEPGTELKLELMIPGQRKAERIQASVAWARKVPNIYGPVGMGLVFGETEAALGRLVDGLVQIAQPVRIDLVGASAYATRHLASLLSSLLECKIQHRELRHHVAQRCAGADLVVVDLGSGSDEALELVEFLATTPNAPGVIVIGGDDDECSEQASFLARVVPSPVDRLSMHRAVLETLAQVRWLGPDAAANMKDTRPAPALQLSQPSPAPVQGSIARAKAPAWNVDASWNQGRSPTASQALAPDLAAHKATQNSRDEPSSPSQMPRLEDTQDSLDEPRSPSQMPRLEDTQDSLDQPRSPSQMPRLEDTQDSLDEPNSPSQMPRLEDTQSLRVNPDYEETNESPRAPGLTRASGLTKASGLTQAPELTTAPGLKQAPGLTTAPGLRLDIQPDLAASQRDTCAQATLENTGAELTLGGELAANQGPPGYSDPRHAPIELDQAS